MHWSYFALAIGAFAVGVMVGRGTGSDTTEPATPASQSESAASGSDAAVGPARVTGLGGIFFRSADPAAIQAWYFEKLGVGSESGVFAFEWLDKDRPDELGYTVWGVFPDATEYFDPSTSTFMVNLRVGDLPGLIERLRGEGVEIVGEIEDHPNGKFAWVLDPEGRKVELWEPVPSADDPYL